jgi:anti-anti-sigma factor
MMIESTRDGGSAVLRVAGRLDREGAEHLSQSLEELLRDGVRSVAIDLSTVTYISSAATTVLSRWRQELAVLRGEVQLTSLPPAVREALDILGWDSRLEANVGSGAVDGPTDLRLSSWQIPATIARSGEYQMSASAPGGTLRCRDYRRLTETGVIVGTVFYMSPEQLREDRDLDQRTDIYSLGCILYEMLTGGPPFTGRSLTEVATRILRAPVPSVSRARADVPAAVDTVLVRALAKSAAARFATMEEFAAALPPARGGVTEYLGQAGVVDLSRAASATRIRSG